jgi:uncharacterized protein (TIGR02118 family)
MYSVIGLLKKPDSWSSEQFREWWLKSHVPIVLSDPGLRDYRLWTIDESIDQKSIAFSADVPFDGVAVITFDSKEAFVAAISSSEGTSDTSSFNQGAPSSTVLGGVPYVFREAGLAVSVPGTVG